MDAWKSRIRLAFDLDGDFLMDAYASGYDVNRLTPKAQHQNLRFGLV